MGHQFGGFLGVLVLVALIGVSTPAAAQGEPWEGMPDLPCIAGNCSLGVGIAESPDGLRRYEGEWKAFVPSGVGRLIVMRPDSADLPGGNLIYGRFQLGNLVGGCRIPLGPYARLDTVPGSIPRCRGRFLWSLRAYHHLVQAQALLEGQAAEALALPLAEVELAVGQGLAHSGFGGGDPDMLDRAAVHLALAAVKATMLGHEPLEERARRLVRRLRSERGETP